MQVFQREQAMLGGMDEAIAILKLCSHGWDALIVLRAPRRRHDRAVGDGDDDRGRLHPLRPSRDRVPRRARAANADLDQRARVARRGERKPIIFMPARHDHHRVQTGDGYAAYVAGAMSGAEIGVTSDAQASWWGGRGVGTVPHSLIAAYGGDTVLAATKFADWAPDDLNITVLVDFENDSVRHGARRRRRARAASSGESGSTPRASSSTARSGTRWATSIREASTSGSSARCARRSTRPASSGSGSSLRAASRSRRSRSSSGAAFRSTPTASARR